MKLTHHQQAVANHSDGHALCVAVAGSGKTSTLARLVCNLLQKDVNHRRLMVMMFNKAAQIDFAQKLHALAGLNTPPGQLPVIRTYHATGLNLLRTLESWHIREPYQKKPLSDKMIELQVRTLILKLAPESLKERIRSDIARLIETSTNFIELVKSHLTTPQAWFSRAGYPNDYRFLIELFHQFESWRHQQKVLTFTDMLYDPVQLIQSTPALVPRVANKMDFIVVDEYQDTSTLQHRFTQLIAGERAQLVAVGDPDQTIYEFAGANIDNILKNFQQDFGQRLANTKVNVAELTMPHTFRYGHSIALAASHLISQNHARKDVLCIAHAENPPSSIEISQSAKDDSRFVATSLQGYLDSGVPPQHIALLVRVWAQAVPIELHLLEAGIQYVSDGPSLFKRPEIAVLIDGMMLASGEFATLNDDDRYQKLTRLLTMPHIGLKQQYVDQLCQRLKTCTNDFGAALSTFATTLTDITKFQARKLRRRGELLTWLEQNGQQRKAHTLIAHYIEHSELYDSLKSMSLNGQRTDEQILAIQGFLRFVTQLDQETGACCEHIRELIEQQRTHQQASCGITLSSCHRAKGLEWPVVLLPGLTCQYWPFLREGQQVGPEAIEAERRLLYVAMTRAKERLHLFTAEGELDHPAVLAEKQSLITPTLGKKMLQKNDSISPFVLEMQLPHALSLAQLLHEKSDTDLGKAISNTGLTAISKRYLNTARPTLKALNDAPILKTATAKKNTLIDEPWQLRAVIDHAVFGRGEVVEVNDSSFSIRFHNHQYGVKRFAKISDIRHLFTAVFD